MRILSTGFRPPRSVVNLLTSCSAFLLLAAARPGSAQEVRGVVLDSASRLSLSGAVVILLDAERHVVARTSTARNGAFVLARPATATRVRVLRIGFRANEQDLVAVAQFKPLEVLMKAVPTMLDPLVTLEQPNCPRRSDYAAAFALWDQAKAGLLAAVIARAVSPPSMINLSFQRRLAENGTDITSQTVLIHSGKARQSFRAIPSAAEFAQFGFMRRMEDADLYLSPDAEVLLNEEFMRAYCLSLAASNSAHPTEVGVAFVPSARKDGTVDVSGTIWIDTAARTLQRFEFEYVGLDHGVKRFHPGGRIEFQDLRDGGTQIVRWSVRIPVERPTLGRTHIEASAGEPIDVRRYDQWERGGELARATWADGITWRAPLGTLRLHVRTSDGSPARGTVVSLDGTAYRATTDSAGNLEISDVLPGPYRLTVTDSLLAPIKLDVPTSFRFSAVRDSVIEATIALPTAFAVVQQRCRNAGVWSPASYALIGRVVTPDGRPVDGARWRVSVGRSTGDTGSDGIFQYCFGLDLGTEVSIFISRGEEKPTVVTRVLAQKVTAVRIEIPPR